MLKPMPNPGGRFVPLSNGLFRRVDARGRTWDHPSPKMAFDSAPTGPRTAAEGARYGAQMAKRLVGGPRLAYDAEPDTYAGSGAGASNADAVNTIVQWATQNLDEREIEELIAALGNRNMSLDSRRRHAMDARRPSRGMSAAAHASFNELFPDAARIRTW